MLVVWLLVWRYVFLCVYITLADWLLVFAPKSGGGGGGGAEHALENSVGVRPLLPPPVPTPMVEIMEVRGVGNRL